MSETKFNGPWTLGQNSGSIYNCNGTYIAYCLSTIPHPSDHLIAAAPSLYEALENLIFTASKLWDDAKPIKDTAAMTVTHPMIEEAKAALALARGEKP